MFNILIPIIFWALSGPALAQNVTCATRPAGDSSNACASTAFVARNFFPANFNYGTITDQIGGTYIGGNIAAGYNNFSISGKTATQQNIAFGISNLTSVTTGYQNIAIGNHTLPLLTTGYGNLAIGKQVLERITTSSFNTGVGTDVLRYLEDSGGSIIGNVALGHGALGGDDTDYYANSGAGNTALGSWSLQEITTGQRNIGVGMNAGMEIQTGNDNAILGFSAQVCSFNSYATHLPGGCSATGNVAIGSNALQTNKADLLTGIGYFALNKNTTGAYHVAIGSNSLQNETTAVGNLAIGPSSLQGLVTGDYNLGIGGFTLAAAGIKTYNIAIGWSAGTAVSTGGENVLMGWNAGAALTTESNNTFIGHTSGSAVTGISNSTAIGANSAPTKSNQVMLGGSAVTEVSSYGSYVGKTYLSNSAAPTLTSCGTSPSIDSDSTDSAGSFTLGTGGPAGCTVVFSANYPTAAFCTVSPANATAIGTTMYISSQTISGFIIVLGAGTSGAKFQYTCMGK